MTRHSTVVLLLLSLLVMLTQARLQTSDDVIASSENWQGSFRDASTRRHLPATSSLSCSPYCIQRRGNGQCDEECDTSECLRDLGDCTAPESCSDCNLAYGDRHLCNYKCESSGCNLPGLCPMDGTEQFVMVELPDITPSPVMAMFPIMENAVNAQLAKMREDVEIRMTADNYGPSIYGHDNNTDLKVVQMKYLEGGNQYLEYQGLTPAKYTRAIFRVYAPFFLTTNHTAIMDVISHLSSPHVRARVTPFILRKSDLSPEKIEKARSIYNKGIFSRYYGEIEKVFGTAIRFFKQ